ncbi:hypothetical protein [Streptomyces olivochromogenes]|uniref:hypothetical protein n=1 Tax=Streptomyces olivochromogenes TaxID=1963 RepID=UPI00368AB842
MRYFVNDAGGWISVSGDADVFSVIPDGYREVEEAEYNEAAGVITIPAPQEPSGEQ